MRISKNLKQSMLPIMGVALITSNLAMRMGYVDALLIGIGLVLVVVGIIKAVSSEVEDKNKK